MFKIHNDIFNHNNGYFGKIIKNQWIDCGREFWLEKIVKNVENENYIYTLSTVYLGEDVLTNFPRDKLDKKYIGELQGLGFDINSANFDTFVKVLQNEEEEYEQNTAGLYFNHSYLGWQEITIKSKAEYLYKSYRKIGEYGSEYIGNIDVEPKGRMEDEIANIKAEVEGNIPLEAVLSIGASAVVCGYIGDLVHTDTLIVHLFGDSTQGKTTAAQLAVSIAGSCDLRKQSLLMSWNSTYNGIITRMKGNYGFPVAFDEISKFQGKDLSGLVYTLSDGREKDRCNKDATLKSISKFDCWHTTIISTGESSLLNKCNNNTGLKVRVLELDDVFTKSAQNAEAIKKSVKENYGNIAPLLAKGMTIIGQKKLVNLHAKYKEKFIELCGNLKLIDRIANNVAVFILSSHLLNKIFGLNLDVDGIIQYFADNVKKSNVNRDIADEALYKLMEFVNVHKKNFMHKYMETRKRFQADKNYNPTTKHGMEDVEEVVERDYTASECYGKIIDGNCLTNSPDVSHQILIYKERFGKIIKDLGFEDERVIIKKMKAKGYLDCEDGKNYRKRKIRDTDNPRTTHVVVINEPKGEDIVSDEEEAAVGSLITPEAAKNPLTSSVDSEHKDKSIDKIIGFDDEETLPDFLFEEDDELETSLDIENNSEKATAIDYTIDTETVSDYDANDFFDFDSIIENDK